MVFEYAIAVGELKQNPMEKITFPVIEIDEEKLPNFYERNTLVQFLTRMEKLYSGKRYMFFHLLAYTGLRKGEALSLTWQDIDFHKKTLSVNKTLAVGKSGALLIQKPKTKTSNRTISIDQATSNLIKNWQTQQQHELHQLGQSITREQLVFSTSENAFLNPITPTSWLDSFYNKNPKMDRITVHGFRHTRFTII